MRRRSWAWITATIASVVVASGLAVAFLDHDLAPAIARRAFDGNVERGTSVTPPREAHVMNMVAWIFRAGPADQSHEDRRFRKAVDAGRGVRPRQRACGDRRGARPHRRSLSPTRVALGGTEPQSGWRRHGNAPERTWRRPEPQFPLALATNRQPGRPLLLGTAPAFGAGDPDRAQADPAAATQCRDLVPPAREPRGQVRWRYPY